VILIHNRLYLPLGSVEVIQAIRNLSSPSIRWQSIVECEIIVAPVLKQLRKVVPNRKWRGIWRVRVTTDVSADTVD
jgi:hypothetical protein